MSEQTPTVIPFQGAGSGQAPSQIFFTMQEMQAILNVYGRMVAAGQWKDYAMSPGREIASIAFYRNASERPVYEIVKNPALRKKQGAFSILSAQGKVLKRGHDLDNLLKFFDRKLIKLV
ncbi:DUF2794 domain-containing protein [Emcibacter sp.]|uniref:DUF2794 domain-containing protein n=1 Tax=Emcibacter sp. TaxID=1979954 RepID=UPI003A93C6DD